MPRVLLSLGSNIDRERHIRAALDALAETFGALRLSPLYESEAVGFAGENFYNLVVVAETRLTVGELAAKLRAIEDSNARCRGGEKFSARTLDIDILIYGDLVGTVDGIALPRDEILRHAFVLRPLADLIPDERHPLARRSYRELAAEFDSQRQRLWPVPFCWQHPAPAGAAPRTE